MTWPTLCEHFRDDIRRSEKLFAKKHDEEQCKIYHEAMSEAYAALLISMISILQREAGDYDGT